MAGSLGVSTGMLYLAADGWCWLPSCHLQLCLHASGCAIRVYWEREDGQPNDDLVTTWTQLQLWICRYAGQSWFFVCSKEWSDMCGHGHRRCGVVIIGCPSPGVACPRSPLVVLLCALLHLQHVLTASVNTARLGNVSQLCCICAGLLGMLWVGGCLLWCH